MRQLRPNFNIKKQDQFQDQQPMASEPMQQSQAPIATKPFMRPPSSRQRESMLFDQSQEQQVEPIQKQPLPKNTPNGFRKFNPQALNVRPVDEDKKEIQNPIQQQVPVINLYKNKQKNQEEVQQLYQQELREKVQVKVSKRPLQPVVEPEVIISPEPANRPKPIKPKEIDPPKKDVNEELREIKINIADPKQNETLNKLEQAPKKKITKMPLVKNTPSDAMQTIMVEKAAEQVDQKQEVKNIIEKSKEQLKKIPQVEYQQRTVPQFGFEVHSVSLNKKDVQKQRVKDLKDLITLEFDDYGNQFQIQPRSQYDLYLNLIKSNLIRNSNDQAFDDVKNQEIQTEFIDYNDFGNQCPEDYHRTFLTKIKKSNNSRLSEFLEYAFDVVEEILNQNSQDHYDSNHFNEPFEIPQKLKLNFNTKILNIGTHSNYNNKLSIYQTCYLQHKELKWLNGTLLISFPKQKLYFTPSQITCLSANGPFLVAGTSDGHIVGWSLIDQIKQENKHQQKLEEIIGQNINFICMSSEWDTSILDPFAECDHHQSAIQYLSFNLQMTSIYEVISLDLFGQILSWQLQELRYDEQDKLNKLIINTSASSSTIKSMQFTIMLANSILICGPQKVSNINKTHYFDDTLSNPCLISDIYKDFFYIAYIDGTIKLYHKDLTNSIETIKWTNRKIIQLFNIDGTCVAIDDENILYYGVQKINLTKDVIKGSKIIHAYIEDKLTLYAVTAQRDIVNHIKHDLMLEKKDLESYLLEYGGF
ncbi:hypothetical protein pb186bvf_004405 [Paramecium bursaria]